MENSSSNDTQLTVAGIEVGSSAIVKHVRGNGVVSRRLMEMGIVPGVKLRIVKVAPFGDPIEIRILGYNLALRRNEADNIEVLLP